MKARHRHSNANIKLIAFGQVPQGPCPTFLSTRDLDIPQGYIQVMVFLLLGLLHDGPRTLYDLHRRFADGISLFYAASFGSIQRALDRARDSGWVTVDDVPDSARGRKLYSLTAAGRARWREWMAEPPTGSNPEQTMLAKVYLLGRLPETERAACLVEIRARLDADAATLAALAADLDAAEVPDAAIEKHRFERATLDYGLRSHALALQWLGELEAS
ncbi:transcriptional regulator PadR-like protein [Mycobacteroides abscessus subsp. abscessus]|nr:transcriptional regulator PadR-like protein [Mycobacteroides abscessus subsp. abscessus]